MTRRHILFAGSIIMIGCLFSSGSRAGTSGKITGRVSDAETGLGLPGVNLILEGTAQGAASDLTGRYVILNVRPGIYTLRATMIGYAAVRVENVRVSIDLTTEIDIEMSTTVLESGEAVTVIAERPLVVRDLTATTAVISAEEIAALPVTEISDAIALQAGLVRDAGGGFHVRGGRSGEISYWIDGVPVTDVYDGGTVVDVNKDMVQELQVVSGAFNAEYGQAMSGIVNITTKEGDNQFRGGLTTYFGDYLSGHKGIFLGIDRVNPIDIRNFEGSLQGPLIKDKVFFSLSGRHIYFDGWLHGRRDYYPHAVTTMVELPGDVVAEQLPEYLDRGRQTNRGLWGFNYVLGSNAWLDSMVTREAMPQTIRSDPDSFGRYYDRFRTAHQNGLGDRAIRPMNWNRKIYTQGKLVYRIRPSLKLSYHYILDDVDYSDYWRDYQLNPDGSNKKFRTGQTHILQWTHALSARTFYRADVSYFTKRYEDYAYSDPYDPRYVHPDLGMQLPYSFKTSGTANTRFQRETATLLAKFDLTSQITLTHQIKTGIEFRRHRVDYRDVTLRPVAEQTQMDFIFNSPFIQTRILPDSTIYASRYTRYPMELSAFIQDKMEFRNMIVNVGVRMDYFEPDGVILADESDPSIYAPIKPGNRYHDWGSDGIPGTFDPDGTEGNGIWDPGEPAVNLAERRTYWYKKASPKLQFSPRLGVSFPITDRGVIHFSYGHFFQIPRFERLYQNPDFELGSGTGNVGVIGNADLKPEHTVSGEIGLQQQISDDLSLHVTGYFRDIRNLAGTRAEEIVIFGGAAKYSKFVNSDFGFVKGMIVALSKRFSNNYSASLDYTLQVARGSNSDPEQARNALAGGSLPEVQLTPLDWDQKHTINGSFTYGAGDWGVSLIGQVGSGMPFTPRRSEDITALLTNSQLKPMTHNVDLRAYKDFRFGPGRLTWFIRIFNLFDTLNEINVYNDTGRAGFTTDINIAQATRPPELINPLTMWFINPTHYSEPRRIETGLTYSF